MAVHVEDHPIEYFDFEGVIPQGQYGAGDVIVWDWGTWTPEAETPDPAKAIEDGELKFVLDGQKVKGRFTIVRTSRRPGSGADDRVRGRQRAVAPDQEARRDAGRRLGRRGPPAERQDRPDERRGQGEPRRDLDQRAAGRGRRDRPRGRGRAGRCPTGSSRWPRPSPARPFSDPDWLFEIKWDGYRVEAVVRDGTAKLWTRSLQGRARRTSRTSSRRRRWIDAGEAIVDGEVVALDEEGRPDFSLLQERISSGAGRARRRDRRRRRARLPGVRPALPRRPLAPRRPARGPQAAAPERPARDEPGPLRVARRRRRRGVHGGGRGARGLEGIVAKLRRSRYEPGQAHAGLAEAEDPARAGARRRRLDAGRGQRAGPRGGRGRRLRGRASSGSPARSGRASPRRPGSGCSRRWRRSSTDDAAVRSAAAAGLPRPLGRRPQRRHLDPAGARDPRRARRLDARRASSARRRSRGSRRAATRRLVVREEAVSSARRSPRPRQREPETRRSRRCAAEVDAGEAEGGGDAEGAAGAGAADGTPRRLDACPSAAEPDELEALATMPAEGVWHVGGERGDDLKLTNLDKVLFGPPPADPSGRAGHEARADRATSPGSRRRCCPTSPSGRSTSSASRTAPTGPSFWQKDIPSTAPTWLRRWREVGVDDREGERAPDRRPGRDAVLARQPGRVRGPRLDVAARGPDRGRRSP